MYMDFVFGNVSSAGLLDYVTAWYIRAAQYMQTVNAADEIRKKLYNLKKGIATYKIVDLGNLNPGHDLDETYLRISEVCKILLESNVLPLLIGGPHNLDYGQYIAYESMEKLVSMLNVDAFLDLDEKKESSANLHHVHKILLHEPNFLFSYSHLAYQSYLIDPLCLSVLEKGNNKPVCYDSTTSQRR